MVRVTAVALALLVSWPAWAGWVSPEDGQKLRDAGCARPGIGLVGDIAACAAKAGVAWPPPDDVIHHYDLPLDIHGRGFLPAPCDTLDCAWAHADEYRAMQREIEAVPSADKPMETK